MSKALKVLAVVAVIVGVVSLIDVETLGTVRYVDGACPNNGNGQADSCAASSGGTGRYNDLQSALTACAAGQTIRVRAGIYISTRGSFLSDGGGFIFGCSGTSTNKVTLTDFGDGDVILKPCADGAAYTSCERATLNVQSRSWVRITSTGCTHVSGCGIHVSGQILLSSTTDVELDHVEVTGGNDCDGNWSTVFTNSNTRPYGHHIYGHSLAFRSGCNGNGAGGVGAASSFIKNFVDQDAIWEYNTLEQANGELAVQFCIDDKDSNQNNHFRYNFCRTDDTQEDGFSGTHQGTNNPGDKVYHNVFIMNGTAGSTDTGCVGFGNPGGAVGFYAWNNTCLRFPSCFINGATNLTVHEFYNNICDAPTRNIQDYNGDAWTLRDYNIYTSGRTYKISGTDYANLAAVVSATNDDDHSSENALTAWAVSETAYAEDLTLSGSSPALNACKVGGVVGGATIDCGAYSNGITCVGAFCEGTPEPPGSSGSPRLRLRVRAATLTNPLDLLWRFHALALLTQ